jgi:hypothetical protein
MVVLPATNTDETAFALDYRSHAGPLQLTDYLSTEPVDVG